MAARMDRRGSVPPRRFRPDFSLAIRILFNHHHRQLMKIMLPHRVLATCCWFALASVPHAQTGTPDYDPLGEFDHLPKQIRVQAEFIEVSHEQLTELLFAPKVPANDTDLRKQLAQLVKDGKAGIVETLLCTARSGQKATTESIEEFIYPTEYEPAELPEDIQRQGQGRQNQNHPAAIPPSVPLPTAFETRNLGSTLEIEPTLSEDNKIIDLRFVPEIVYHVGNTVWAEWKGEHGNSPIQMPTIYTLRVNTSVTLADGQTMLVAALSPKNKDGVPDFTRKLMVFVKADVITTGR